MRTNFIIISYATANTPYEAILKNHLLKSLIRFNQKNELNYFYTEKIENLGSWYKNTAFKPKFILNMFKQFPYFDIVYIDADATIEKYPTLFAEIPEEYDIAYHTLIWNNWYGYKHQPSKTELLTGTMFFKNRDNVKALCKEWYEEAMNTNTWEQKVLERIISKHPVKIYPLPLEYCYMKSRPNNLEPLVKLDPVILHHQVSRDFKRRMR